MQPVIGQIAFEKLQNGEIDILGDIAYTEERTDRCCFQHVPMGVEKYYLYADFSSDDISSTDFKTLMGKRIGCPYRCKARSDAKNGS